MRLLLYDSGLQTLYSIRLENIVQQFMYWFWNNFYNNMVEIVTENVSNYIQQMSFIPGLLVFSIGFVSMLTKSSWYVDYTQLSLILMFNLRFLFFLRQHGYWPWKIYLKENTFICEFIEKNRSFCSSYSPSSTVFAASRKRYFYLFISVI